MSLIIDGVALNITLVAWRCPRLRPDRLRKTLPHLQRLLDGLEDCISELETATQ